METTKTTKAALETLNIQIEAARAAFLRASTAVDEMAERVTAAGGGDTGEETEAARFLMTTYRAREARLFEALKHLDHLRAERRLTETFAQLTIWEVAA